MGNIINVGACWKTKSGKGYNCKFDNGTEPVQKFTLFKNSRKTEDNHPDLNMVIFEDDDTPAQSQREEPVLIPDDEIPF